MTSYPLNPTKFASNPYDPEWFDRDFFHSQDGVKEFPNHHCKETFLVSFPFIKRFRTAIDIGCRDGEYARYLQKHFDHTFGFDPRFRENFAYNVDLAKTTHFTCALGDDAGVIQMYGGTHPTPGTVVPNPAKLKAMLCLKLDSFGFRDVDYVKIDVEGFERKVMVGGEETIMRDRPLIVIEQNDVHLEGEGRYDAKEWLEARGYRHVATCKRGWDYVMAPE